MQFFALYKNWVFKKCVVVCNLRICVIEYWTIRNEIVQIEKLKMVSSAVFYWLHARTFHFSCMSFPDRVINGLLFSSVFVLSQEYFLFSKHILKQRCQLCESVSLDCLKQCVRSFVFCISIFRENTQIKSRCHMNMHSWHN